ncbi:MAG TPA: cobalamin-dependent protein, partial [Thermoanaerobaculia bacterium]|nr:cobalamin-dependent protein [Thermoanaerobaculia bacterium]
MRSERDRYLEAILAGRRQDAVEAALGALERGMDVRDVYVDVLQESLYEVGRLWQAGRISVATEHLATAITQLVVARLYEKLPRSEAMRGRVVLTGVEGELHQVGGNMIADALEADGWDVRFLGTDVPGPDVLDAIAAHRADLFGISCTLRQNVPKVSALVDAVRARFGEARPRILVGGGAFRASGGGP